MNLPVHQRKTDNHSRLLCNLVESAQFQVSHTQIGSSPTTKHFVASWWNRCSGKISPFCWDECLLHLTLVCFHPLQSVVVQFPSFVTSHHSKLKLFTLFCFVLFLPNVPIVIIPFPPLLISPPTLSTPPPAFCLLFYNFLSVLNTSSPPSPSSASRWLTSLPLTVPHIPLNAALLCFPPCPSLFSASVEPLRLHRYSDGGLCRGCGLLLRHSARRYSNNRCTHLLHPLHTITAADLHKTTIFRGILPNACWHKRMNEWMSISVSYSTLQLFY